MEQIADGFNQTQSGDSEAYGKLSFQIGDAGRSCAASRSRPKRAHTEEVKTLMQQRRDTKDTDARKIISKKIWKALRTERRIRYAETMDSLAQAGAGVKRLRQMMQRDHGNALISGIRDEDGKLESEATGIAKIFAVFYERLYNDSECGSSSDSKLAEVLESEPAVDVAEVEQALKRLKNNKTGADDGLVAEMLKTGHRPLLQLIARLFTDILCHEMEAPSAWKLSRLKLLFKSGDPLEPKNYRPITVIPVLSKLFSVVLYGRIATMIESKLGEEQFGFRPGRGCSDAVHTLRIVVEKALEWGQELWVAALDVEKAFDRVTHHALFHSMLKIGLSDKLVKVLKLFYSDLKAYIELDGNVNSRSFDVLRGVRQGDPLSPLLFNVVMNDALEEVKAKWRNKGHGTIIGESLAGERLTHVAFADDMTLLTHSWKSMRAMLVDIRNALLKRGLSLHPSKCNVQTNCQNIERRGILLIQPGFAVNLLPEGE